MANTIKVTYKVNDAGSLERISKNAEKAAKATDGISKSKNRYNKIEKGAAQLTSNSTKAFSKQAGAIGSGLVPAYATLAANVFAVTAAFGILSRSQAVKQLNEGLLFTGREAGQNLTIVTKNLRDITENAISSADAMRALAIGVSAGFSEDQMKGLTRVAKGASLALGRDMTDALDRLVRGAAKLEPEILDELGIMIRLDDVTEAYAASLGIAVSELTQFERRMAFTNGIIEQGTQKFGALSHSVSSNPFNQLAATFDDLVKGGMNFINLVIAPIAGFLAGNMSALVATIGVLGTGVIKMMVPALTEAGKASAELAEQMADSAKQTIAATKATAGSPKVFTQLAKGIADGTASAEDFTKAQNSLIKSVDTHKRQLPGMIASHGEDSDIIKKKKLVIKENELALRQLTSAQHMETLATQKAASADILATASAGNFKVMIKLLRAEMIRESIQVQLSTANNGFLAASYIRIASAARIAMLSVKAFGLALLQSIPVIGQVILFSMFLWEGIKWLFGSDAKETVNPLAKTLEEGKQRFEEFPNIIKQMADSYELATSASERYIINLKVQNGLIAQTLTHVRDLRIAESVNQRLDLAAVQRKLAAAKKTEADARALLKQAGVETTEGEKVNLFSQALERLVGINFREGVEAKDRIGAMNAVNQALKDQAILEGQIAQLQAASAGPSETRLRATMEGLMQLSETLKSGLPLDQTSEEFELMSASIAEVDRVLGSLNSETIGEAEAALASLSGSVNATEASFIALKEVGAEVDALFAKEKAVTGVFSEEIKLLDKGLAAVARTIGSDIQTDGLKDAFKKFGVSNEKQKAEVELQALRDRFAAASDFRKDEAKLNQESTNERDKLNSAGLKEVALGKLVELQLKRRTAIEEEIKLLKEGEERDTLKQDLELLKLVNEEEKTRIDLINERQQTAARLGGSAMGSVTAVTAYGEINQETFKSAATSDQIKMLSTAIEPMLKDLEKLAPEGALIVAAMAGTLALGESFERLTEKLEKLGFTSDMTFTEMAAKFTELEFEQKLKVIGGSLQLVGNAIAALGNAIAAAAANNIAGVDKQIEAEKKRDGQSAASLGKIKQLEAKKEQMKRKEFEINKKFQMANAIIATAVGVTQALAIPGIGIALAGMIAAMGAAQVAIISGMTYQGGGAGGVQTPNKISVGNRQNSVDLAKARSPSGELAFARGAQGTGSGMTNFTPAFTGAKYRAGGGNVGLMVGEQGPEMFIPDRPGTIVPADDTQGLGGRPVNVNFSIQAIDSAGVQDLLMVQRGNIIGMIREAANSHGELFLENINNQSLPVDRQSRRY